MTPPDLKDPAQRAAYMQELRSVARGIRLTGLLLAFLGAGLAAARQYRFPELPGWLPVGVVGIGLMLMITAISARTSYHRQRMRKD